MTILANPNDWVDAFAGTPPLQWEAVDQDDRFWWSNVNGNLNGNGGVTYIGAAPLPASLVFAWEIVVPPDASEGIIQLWYRINGAPKQTEDLGVSIGSGQLPVDLTGATTFEWGVQTTIDSFANYQSVTAVGDAPPLVPATCDDIGRATRAYVSAYDLSKVHQVRLYRFAKRCLIANFNGAIPPARSIFTATWRTDAPEIGVMSAPQISANQREATVLFASQLGGWANMRCEVTLDNGEIYNQVYRVNVREASFFFNDPPTQPGPFSVSVSA